MFKRDYNFLSNLGPGIAQRILGVDVSHHQGVIDWSKVSQEGKTFAYVKSTEGMTHIDPKFHDNIRNGAKAGLVMGAYHFARPDNNTAQNDATNFINTAGPYIGKGKLPPALDLEDQVGLNSLSSLYTSTQLTNWVKEWLTIVEDTTGIAPIIYTNSFYAQFLNSSINAYGLWIAKPDTSPTTRSTDLGIWNNEKLKQYSWKGSVNGISGFTDLNAFIGNIHDFNDFIKA